MNAVTYPAEVLEVELVPEAVGVVHGGQLDQDEDGGQHRVQDQARSEYKVE